MGKILYLNYITIVDFAEKTIGWSRECFLELFINFLYDGEQTGKLKKEGTT